MSLRELDASLLNGQDLRSWLFQISMPIVILVRSGNFNRIKCQSVLQMLEEISQKPEFRDVVIFLHFDADEYFDFCKTISVMRVPTIIIYRTGKEIIRFSDGVNAGTIIQQLHIITDPVRNHPVA